MDAIDKLIRFCGYGNFESANVLFLGNEEGLGGGEIRRELKRRIVDFWEKGKAIDGLHMENGYYLDQAGDEDTTSPFLEFCSRLMLKLNYVYSDNLFLTRGEDPEVYEKIRDYKIHQLYHENEQDFNYRSVLIDYRPLPRANESLQYSIYHEINEKFNWEHYYSAFKFSKNHIDDYHCNLRNDRSKILYNVFNRESETKVIIGIGDRHTKKRFFEEYFEILNPFVGRKLGKGKEEVYYGRIQINKNVIPVFLSNFFQSGHGIGLKGLSVLHDMIIHAMD